MLLEILDSGTNDFIVPINFPNVTSYKPIVSIAQQASRTSNLKIVGTGKFGIFDVSVADIHRPLFSEGILQSDPYNLSIIKHKNRAWIIDTKLDSTHKEWLALSATLGADKLYHIDNLNRLLNYKGPLLSQYTVKPYDNTSVRNRTTSNKSTYGTLNLLEVLHVILGHAPGSFIKYIVKHNIVTDLHVSYDSIKNLTLGLCDTCMQSRMKAFPMYKSLSQKIYGIFEYLSFDILELGKTCRSIDGYIYSIVIVDKESNRLFVYGTPAKSDLLDCFKRCIYNHGPKGNPRSIKLTYLNTDNESCALDDKFLKFCTDEDIHLQLSSPYKHQQNLIETYIESIKNGMRAALIYNQAPLSLWFHALKYHVYTYNHLPKSNGELINKRELIQIFLYYIKTIISL